MSFRRRRSAGISWQSVALVSAGAIIGAVVLVLVLGRPGEEPAPAAEQTPPSTALASAEGPGGAATLAPLTEPTSPSAPAAQNPTPSGAPAAPTMPPLPTAGPAPLPTATVPTREQIEASIRDAAERFQQAKEHSQRTGETSRLSEALARDALARQIALVNETKAAGCYWEITHKTPMTVEIIELRDNNYARIRVEKTESRSKYCDGKLESSVTDDTYSAGYVVELIDGTWYVTERE